MVKKWKVLLLALAVVVAGYYLTPWVLAKLLGRQGWPAVNALRLRSAGPSAGRARLFWSDDGTEVLASIEHQNGNEIYEVNLVSAQLFLLPSDSCTVIGSRALVDPGWLRKQPITKDNDYEWDPHVGVVRKTGLDGKVKYNLTFRPLKGTPLSIDFQ